MYFILNLKILCRFIFVIYYRKVNDGNFGWRALRLLARRSPHFFVHGNYPINKLPEYLETMIKKIAKDRPVSIILLFYYFYIIIFIY